MRYIHRQGCPHEGKTVRIIDGHIFPEQRIEAVEHRLDLEVARKQGRPPIQTTVRCIECNAHEVYPVPRADVLIGLLAELEAQPEGEPERRANRKGKETIDA